MSELRWTPPMTSLEYSMRAGQRKQPRKRQAPARARQPEAAQPARQPDAEALEMYARAQRERAEYEARQAALDADPVAKARQDLEGRRASRTLHPWSDEQYARRQEQMAVELRMEGHDVPLLPSEIEEQARRDERSRQESAALARDLGCTSSQVEAILDADPGNPCIQNLFDQPKLPKPGVRTIPEMQRKVKDERDDSPGSLDWNRAPDGSRMVFELLAGQGELSLMYGAGEAGGLLADACNSWAAQRGEPLGQDPDALWKAQLKWLAEGNGWPLIELLGEGRFRMIADRPRPAGAQYPGCPEDVNPKAGKCLAGKMDSLIAMIRKAEPEASYSQVAMIINSPEVRKAFCLQECRYASVTAVHEAHKRAPNLHQRSKARRHRDRHAWVVTRHARWEVTGPVDETRLPVIREAVRKLLHPRPDDLRERLAA